MTTSNRDKRATVAIGPLSVDGFQMPDGGYWMSLNSASEAVGLLRWNAFEFLRLKAAKRLLGAGFTGSIFEAKPDKLCEQAAGLEQQLHDAGLELWQLPLSER